MLKPNRRAHLNQHIQKGRTETCVPTTHSKIVNEIMVDHRLAVGPHLLLEPPVSGMWRRPRSLHPSVMVRDAISFGDLLSLDRLLLKRKRLERLCSIQVVSAGSMIGRKRLTCRPTQVTLHLDRDPHKFVDTKLARRAHYHQRPLVKH